MYQGPNLDGKAHGSFACEWKRPSAKKAGCKSGVFRCLMLCATCVGLVEKDKVGVMGGSHGGFLTGNLVGQYPSSFKCGVLRNPVMDLGLMIHCSDIPDWCYIEAFGSKVCSDTDRSAFICNHTTILQNSKCNGANAKKDRMFLLVRCAQFGAHRTLFASCVILVLFVFTHCIVMHSILAHWGACFVS